MPEKETPLLNQHQYPIVGNLWVNDFFQQPIAKNGTITIKVYAKTCGQPSCAGNTQRMLRVKQFCGCLNCATKRPGLVTRARQCGVCGVIVVLIPPTEKPEQQSSPSRPMVPALAQ